MFPCNVSGNVIQELLMEPAMSCEDQHRNTVDNIVSGMQKRKRGRPRKIVVEQSLNKARSSSGSEHISCNNVESNDYSIVYHNTVSRSIVVIIIQCN